LGFTGSAGSAAEPKAISLGTSSVGSIFYTLSIVFADVITKNSGVAVTVEPVGGSDATIRGMAAKKVEMGMVNASSAADAYEGIGSYSKTGKVPISLVCQGMDSLRQIVVRQDSGIKTINDLVGKKFIARRKALPEIEKIVDILFELYGVDKKKVNILETAETNEAMEALKVGTVDAAVIPSGIPASYLLDIFRTTKVAILDIPDDKLKVVLSRMGSAFHTGFLPANTYQGQNYAVRTPAMSALLVVRSDLPEESVYKMTKALFGHQDDIKAGHASGKEWTLNKTLEDPPIPFHPGAIRYFKEIGVWGKK
ncbi:MAG: TAXI family TRAP transporter solute-binding subunit, partial [Deltaproteobacteria bacterium]|nr:TAXI family TRAP transporter solute-binding subunit [Deltaproteobacteria bacterium]